MQPDLHWAQSLIGKPWVAGAHGPEAFDCWGLVLWVYKHQLGVELPAYADTHHSVLMVMRDIAKEASGSHWTQLDQPEHLCAVSMATGARWNHVGVGIGSRNQFFILHSTRDRGVCAQSLVSARHSGISKFAYYRYSP